MAVEKPAPVCACCGERITGVWMVTGRAKVYVICGGCEKWAHAQGLTIVSVGHMAAGMRTVRRPPRRRQPTCDHCGQPRRTQKHSFPSSRRDEQGRLLVYCTLTCKNSAELPSRRARS